MSFPSDPQLNFYNYSPPLPNMSKPSNKKNTKRGAEHVTMDELRALKKTTVQTAKKLEHKRTMFIFTGYYMRTFEGGQLQFSITEPVYKQAMTKAAALGYKPSEDNSVMCTAKFNERTGTYTITGKFKDGTPPAEPCFVDVESKMCFGLVGKKDERKPCLYFQVTSVAPIQDKDTVEDIEEVEEAEE